MHPTTTSTPTQDADIRSIVDDANESGQLTFLVVYGSMSRGEQRVDSDLDARARPERLEPAVH